MAKHVAIVNFNTPRLTECAIRSVRKHTPGCTFHVFDNSDSQPYTTTAPAPSSALRRSTLKAYSRRKSGQPSPPVSTAQ